MSSDLSAKPVRVLAVDDQPLFRAAAQQVVEATAGFAWVGEAASGAEAIELVRERRPDIVIIDVRMPDMDGIETARRVTGACPGVTVLLVSAEPLASPAADLLRSGAAVFSPKHNFSSALLHLLRQRERTRTTTQP